MREDLSPVQEKLLQLWRDYYPILYWANRINKINPLNPHDKLEAVSTLLQIADAYVTIFVASIKNPNEPWYFVKERAYENDIGDVLDEFRSVDGERVDLRNYDGDLENITKLGPREGWEVSTSDGSWEARPMDLFAWILLGCPGEQDFDEKQLVFQENPEQYIEVCNGVINFRQNWKHLLNDLKHGFRLLPFEWDAMEELQTIAVDNAPGFDLEEKKQEYEETNGDYVYFWRLVGKEGQELEQAEGIPEGYEAHGFGLYVYRIDLDVCRGLARAMTLLLNNLITPEPVTVVKEIQPFLDESGRVVTFEEFIPITMLAES